MDFDLNAEQKMLKKSAREFFSKEVDSELVRDMELDETGHNEKIWKKMAKLGWQGLLIPEAYGGEGMEFLDMAVVLEEMGSSALPGPFFTSCLASALTIIEAADEDQKKNFLPTLAAGKKIFTLAWNEKNSGMTPVDIATEAIPTGDQYELSGTKLFVPYAHISNYLIIAARTGEPGENGEGGISLFLVDRHTEGLSIELIKNSSGEKLCEVDLKQVPIPAKNLIGKPNQGWKILSSVLLRCAVAESAKMVGAAQKVLKMTIDYAKEREQFGRPIGSFQAIQHHCANMKTLLDGSALLTNKTSWKISTGEGWEKQAAMCKAWTGEALRKMIMLGHQVMGGFGFIEEVDVQLYYRRARAAEIMFGDGNYHRELVAQKMEL